MNEPVAWMEYIQGEEWEVWFVEPTDLPKGHTYKPLYTHPVKELTDEEIEGWIVAWAKDLYGTLYVEPTDHQRTMAIKMARAILKKASEK